MVHSEAARESAKHAAESQRFLSDTDLPQDLNYRDYLRLAIDDIQKVVQETKVSAKLGDELTDKLQKFSEAVKSEMRRLASTDGTTTSDILGIHPAHKEKLTKNVDEALRVHLIGFFRANQKDLSGTIFEEPITNEAQNRARSHYIQEFISNYLAHLHIIDNDESRLENLALVRLATRKMPEFTESFFYGTYIHDCLEKAGVHMSEEDERLLFKDWEKRRLIWNSLGSIEENIANSGKRWIALESPDYIARFAGKLPKPVMEIFVPSVRRYMAQVGTFDSIPQLIKRGANNYRLLHDTEALVRQLESEHELLIVSDSSHLLSEGYTHSLNMLFSKDILDTLARWLRNEISFGRRDSARKSIKFKDLRVPSGGKTSETTL